MYMGSDRGIIDRQLACRWLCIQRPGIHCMSLSQEKDSGGAQPLLQLSVPQAKGF